MIRPPQSCPHCGGALSYHSFGARCYCTRCSTVGVVTKSTETSCCVAFTREPVRRVERSAADCQAFAIGLC